MGWGGDWRNNDGTIQRGVPHRRGECATFAPRHLLRDICSATFVRRRLACDA
jgi:hypothetical protein